MAWSVSFDPRALSELEKLDRTAQRRIVKFFQERVVGSGDPRSLGKALVGEKTKLWRYRIGDYRAVGHIHDQRQSVRVLRVAHRREAYR